MLLLFIEGFFFNVMMLGQQQSGFASLKIGSALQTVTQSVKVLHGSWEDQDRYWINLIN